MTQYGAYRPRAADPSFDRLWREMDALLGRFGNQAAPQTAPRGVFPAVNLYECPDAYVLTAELPGVEPDAIQAQLEGSTVVLRGERKPEYTSDQGTSAHRMERPFGSFRRAFELPAEIDADKVEALHRNGVLMLRLPKTPERQPRQIAIQTS